MRSYGYKRVLFFGFSLLISVIVLISLTSTISLNRIQNLFTETYSVSMSSLTQTQQAGATLNALQSAMKDVVMSRSETELKAALDSVAIHDSQMKAHFASLSEKYPGNLMLTELMTAYVAWEPIRMQTLELMKSGEYALAQELTNVRGGLQVELIGIRMQQLTDSMREASEARYNLAAETVRESQNLIYGLTAFLFLLTVIASVFIVQWLSRYERALVREREQLRQSREHYRMLYTSMMNGYALHEMIFDKDGVPCDYRFVDVNPAFETLTGIRREDCIGKTVIEVLPSTEDYWIETYGKVVMTGEPIRYENYSAEIDKYFEVYAFRPIENHFAVLIADVTERRRLDSLVHKEREQLRITFESIGDGIITTDRRSHVTLLNRVAEEMTGWTSEDAVGKPFLEVFNIINAQTGERGKNPVEEVLTTDSVCELANHTILVSKDGTKRHIADSAAPVKDTEGKTTGVVMVFRDVTEKKRVEKLLRASEEKYRLMTEFTSDVIWVYNVLRDVFTYCSPSVYQQRGMTPDEVVGASLEDVLTPESYIKTQKAFEENIRNFINDPERSNSFINEIEQPCKNGRVIPIETNSKFHYNAEGEIEVIGVSRSLEERKKAAYEIEYASYHDALTGLYNRRKFEMKLEQIDGENTFPVSIIMGDVNGLKLINDAFGHSNGDEILSRIAEILKTECGADACVARHGGDEFSAILPGATYDQASRIVKKIRKRCVEETSNELMLNISFGIGTKENASDDLNMCYHLAEERMYTSKLLEAKSIRNTIISNLRTVMEEKTGETQKHCERIADLAHKIGEQMGMQSYEIEHLELLALLHDIGKTGIPDYILLKTQKLTEDEWRIIQKHSEIGFRIASTMPELVPIADGVLSHHERWDGAGYPRGLVGDDIPVMSRIVAVLDSYDAMINDRPYRQAMTEEEAIGELKRCAGTQFDPKVVDIFLNRVLVS